MQIHRSARRKDPKRVHAAKKAWITIRAKRSAAKRNQHPLRSRFRSLGPINN
jgi:hypothetical protein